MFAVDGYIGLDVGTTHIKALLLDEVGRVRGVRAADTPLTGDAYGFVHDPAALLTAAQGVVASLVRDCGRGVAIRAMAVASMGEEGVWLDAEGQVRYPAVAWYETRPSKLQDHFVRTFGEAARQASGLPLKPTYSLFKWFWLKEVLPAVWDAGARWLPISEFFAWSLTGEAVISPSQATRTYAYLVTDQAWSEELLAPLRPQGREFLPPVVASGTGIGTVAASLAPAWGLGASTVVAVGGHDHPVGAIGAQVEQPDQLLDSMGTAESLWRPLQQLPRGKTLAPGLEYGVTGFTVPRYLSGGIYSGMALNVLRKVLRVEAWDAVWAAIEREPGALAGPAVFLPASLGLPPRFELTVWGAEVEVHQIVRAALEGWAFAARRVAEQLEEYVGSPAREIVAIGGGSAIDVAMHIRASVFNRPLTVVRDAEAVAVGAARLAARSVGHNISVPLRRAEVEPKAEWREEYQRRYAMFCRQWERAESFGHDWAADERSRIGNHRPGS